MLAFIVLSLLFLPGSAPVASPHAFFPETHLQKSLEAAHPMSDEMILTELNAQYVRSFMKSDVEWYRQHLADDFVCIESDGSVLDKPKFLAQTAKGPDVAAYHLEGVRVRIFGDTALIHATGAFTRRDGTTGVSRYTDVYIRHNGKWEAVSAQITRAAK